jgi:hypothetical protein
MRWAAGCTRQAALAGQHRSCATCHDPAKGFSDGKKVSEGIGGQKGARNAPTVLNSIFYEFQFWDGRATAWGQARAIINQWRWDSPLCRPVTFL